MPTFEWEINSKDLARQAAYEKAIAQREERIQYIRERFGLSEERIREDFMEVLKKSQQRQQSREL